jgi:hypothetical protein
MFPTKTSGESFYIERPLPGLYLLSLGTPTIKYLSAVDEVESATGVMNAHGLGPDNFKVERRADYQKDPCKNGGKLKKT